MLIRIHVPIFLLLVVCSTFVPMADFDLKSIRNRFPSFAAQIIEVEDFNKFFDRFRCRIDENDKLVQEAEFCVSFVEFVQ